ncbi:SMI1/KNR4 family protein [Xenorhabdus griffiniae]|uniref:SMI1/KNR4 family protein n=1 Tax=Xenorhabdus griffiniae TaxID=351672 RepID=A0ABY9XIH8_9GAMM|nr:SMI1/KNR4 family protein [Xenorhabdus griffiniae]MBD1229589.1 SMI1/KNR4 family protein [Xenorhabdus griffiniae]MBE8589422.1 SMI1/KNR4 family protein [Xenorhabdus griffiniae]WMV72724.1 SMI1/KNR4 family protein [Xenorhabdus griffiniae]WNH02402.1 SMI1/KNR4 family protein [Xenorhabdus griffiniae]
MIANIIDFKGPIDEILVADFESEIGKSLPNDYRNFLKKYNGGYPEPDSFSFINDDEEDASSVDRFLGLGAEKHHNLRNYFFDYKDRIPLDFLPIAHDPGGNLILISLSKDNSGVFFWDHEFEADEGELPDMSNVHLISHSFTEFLSVLYKLEI